MGDDKKVEKKSKIKKDDQGNVTEEKTEVKVDEGLSSHLFISCFGSKSQYNTSFLTPYRVGSFRPFFRYTMEEYIICQV